MQFPQKFSKLNSHYEQNKIMNEKVSDRSMHTSINTIIKITSLISFKPHTVQTNNCRNKFTQTLQGLLRALTLTYRRSALLDKHERRGRHSNHPPSKSTSNLSHYHKILVDFKIMVSRTGCFILLCIFDSFHFFLILFDQRFECQG